MDGFNVISSLRLQINKAHHTIAVGRRVLDIVGPQPKSWGTRPLVPMIVSPMPTKFSPFPNAILMQCMNQYIALLFVPNDLLWEAAALLQAL